MKTIVLSVTGMHCASCGMTIDDALEQVPGVSASSTDLRHERTTVECGEDVEVSALLAAVVEAGYSAAPA